MLAWKKMPSPAGLALIVVLMVGAALLPEVVGAGWHVFHGKSAHYRGWDIPVPTGWFAVHQGEGLAVERMLRFALWRDAPTIVFLPVHVTDRYVFDRSVWQRVQVQMQVHNGYQLTGTRDIQAAGQAGYCWEFARRQDAGQLWVTCIVPAERLSADFRGDRAYLAAFYAILPGISRDLKRPAIPS